MRFLPVFLLVAAIGTSQDLGADLTRFRQAEGLSVPAWDQELAASCSQRAQVLKELGVLSHLDGQGRGPGAQLLAQGSSPGEYGEVLAAGQDEKQVWKAWLESPLHRGVLARAGWVKWGVGTVTLGSTRIWVVRFWRP